MILAQTTTGKIALFERGCVTMIFFCLFFWNSNVNETASALWRISGTSLLISLLPRKNRMLYNRKRFVFSLPCTVRYSQLRRPKKKYPHSIFPSASSNGVEYSCRVVWKLKEVMLVVGLAWGHYLRILAVAVGGKSMGVHRYLTMGQSEGSPERSHKHVWRWPWHCFRWVVANFLSHTHFCDSCLQRLR